MTRQAKPLSQKLLLLVLSALLVLPAFYSGPGQQIAAAAAGPTDVIGTTLDPIGYFQKKFPALQNDPDHVFRTVTYHEFDHVLTYSGNYIFLVGGAWDNDTQAAIGSINKVAKEYGITGIHQFDPRLDGVNANTDIRSNAIDPLNRRYVDLVNKYLTNLDDFTNSTETVTYTYTSSGANPTTISNSADNISTPFLFIYNKDHKDGGNAAPIVAALGDKPTNTTDYESSLRELFDEISTPVNGVKKADHKVLSNSEYVPLSYNRFSGSAIFDQNDPPIVIEPVTLDELHVVLDSDDTSVILFGCAWCGNTQAVIKFVNEYANKYGIKRVYNWDTKLDGGVGAVSAQSEFSHPKPDDGNFYQTRQTGHRNTNIYVDLVKTYFPDLKTEYKLGASTQIKYTNDQNQEVAVQRLQAPYLFVYNKNNTDTNGKSSPVLGHVELMYSWTNIQPTYNGGVNHATLVEGLKTLFSRLELKPSGLSGVSPTSGSSANGKIKGTKASQEYRLQGEINFQQASELETTGLAAGTYEVRYAAKTGVNGPISRLEKSLYDPSEIVTVVVPEFLEEQAAPAGLIGHPPTAANTDDGQIEGVKQGQEYKALSDQNYAPVTVTNSTYLTGLKPDTYLVRAAAKPGYKASPSTEVIVPNFDEQSQDPPTGLASVTPTSPANDDGQITGVNDSLEYRSGDDLAYQKVTGSVITGLSPGSYFVRKAAAPGYSASPVVEVVVASYVNIDQDPPVGLAGVAPTSGANKDGKITGTVAGLEYKLKGTNNYIQAAVPAITGLSAGTYVVRTAAKYGYNASSEVEIVVPAYSGGTGGNGGGGGGSQPTPTPQPTPQPTDSTGNGQPAGKKNVAVKSVTQTDEATGDVVAVISGEELAGIINKIKEAEAGGNQAVIQLNVETNDKTETAQFTIGRTLFNQISSETGAAIQVNYGTLATIELNAATVKQIAAGQTTGDISLIVTKTSLDEESQKVLGNRPVYVLSAFAGDQLIPSFGKGKAAVSLPYKPAAGEDPLAIIVYNVTDEGALEVIRGKYNAASGTVDFVTDHFSQYIIGYQKLAFSDVKNSDWHHDAITFLAAREITSGTDAEHFSPNQTVSRGQFIVLLLKAYGIQPDEASADNFADAGNTYYTGYLAAAKRLNIAGGVGNNKYEPNKGLSRQELFTLLHRALEQLGELPADKTGKTLNSYNDNSKVAGFAREALSAFVESGVVSGAGGKLNPEAASTRAEVAQVLYNLLSK
ncbi:S-layer homology domain-containing protein [Paenibacillus sp. NPDC058071]|uniref:S-layer homology domain-containing protein n=1 Tax=Paenibacillus sp. NPDC058071 TaxID=3346326 RepID=UPI0036D88E82